MKKVILGLSFIAVLNLYGCASNNAINANTVSSDCCANVEKLNIAEAPSFDNRILTLDVRAKDPEVQVVPSMTIDAKILFEFDKSVLTLKGKRLIATLSDVSSRELNKPIQLVGSTDFFGTDKHNEKLAEKRAIVVRNEFIKNGIPGDKILIKIYLGQREQEIVDNCKVDLKECVAPDRNTSMLIKLDM